MLVIGAKYTKAERDYLQSELPNGCCLDFNFDANEYLIKHRGPKDTHGKIITTRARSVVIKWQNDPAKTMGYVARRAMKVKGIPVAMKRNGA